MEQTRQIIVKWLQKVSEELKMGEEILFPAETKADQKEKKRMFQDEVRVLSKIDPIAASELQVSVRFQDHRFWISIKKVAFSPLIAFKKGTDGNVTRVTMEDNTEKLRRLRLMKSDGYSLEEIKEMEGGLSEEELKFLGR